MNKLTRVFVSGIFVSTFLAGATVVKAENASHEGSNTNPILEVKAPVLASGTAVSLKSVPGFMSRLLVPVLPSAINTFAIGDQAVSEIVSAPAGYRMAIEGGKLRVESPAGEGFGYATVRTSRQELTLTLMNLVPHSEVRNGELRGYKIGRYQAQPLKGMASYEMPKGFIHMTASNADAWVSDHYRLRDFQCKLDGASKFLIVRPEALIKLEVLQDQLAREENLQFSKFTIMSGYRTPYYNSRIGNETSYSRHLYGDAMDIYIDRNGDNNMDDINRDGRVDVQDAVFLLRAAEKIDKSSEWSWLQGGGGVYKANSAHGPYVHVDTRGYVARWGI